MDILRRILRVLAVGCISLVVSPVDAGPGIPPDRVVIADDLSVARISEHVWVHTTVKVVANGHRFPANGLIVITDDGVVLIDTAWGTEATSELLGWVEGSLGQPVIAAVVTHFHDDSLGGATVLADAGIPFFSGGLTPSLAVVISQPAPTVIPGLDVAGGRAGFHGLELLYPGPGHSPDNVVVWIPSDAVLFGTCAVRSPDFPGTGNMADASIEDWPDAIRVVRDRFGDADIVVPGHGSPGTVALLDHTSAALAAANQRRQEPSGGR